jgi:capsular exopolysaccharide synthesis family protein
MPENGNVAISKKEITLPEWRQTLHPVIEAEGIQIYSSLHSYRNILFKHLWLILAVAFALTFVMAIYSVMTKPEYRATARILVEPENQEFQTANDLFHTSVPNDDTFLATQADVLQSDSLAWQTIQQLQLQQAPEFAGYLKVRGAPDSSAAIQANLIQMFKKQLTVERRRDTRMMAVSFDGSDPHLASVIVNALIRNYIEYDFRLRYDATRKTTEWMAQELNELKNKVETSQQALVDYEQRNSIMSAGEKGSIAEQKLADLSRALTDAQRDRLDKESLLQLVTSSKPAASASAVPASKAAQPIEAIEEVRLGQNGERTEVDVTGTGPLNYHVLRLSQPDRIVLDFSGAHLELSDKEIASNVDPVRKVRMAQFSPEKARVVIDLREAAPYSVSANGNTVKVEFGSVKTSRVQPPIAPEAQDSRMVMTKDAPPERDEPGHGVTTTPKDPAPPLPADVMEQSDSSELSVMAQNNVLQKLKERDADLREQYVEALEQYGETFPKVMRLRGQIDEVQTLIVRERKRTIERLRNDLDGSKKREALLTGAVVEQKAEVARFNQLSIQQNMLRREFETNRQLYDNLLQRLKDASVTAGLRSTNIRFVDQATPPPFPVRPKKLRNSVTGLLAGLILGFLLAMTREALDNSIRSAVELETLVDAPVLAVIPYQNGLGPLSYAYRCLRSIAGTKTVEDEKELSVLKKPEMFKWEKERVELSVLQKPGSAISEAFRALRTSILLSTADHAPQVILVTSSQPNEGKTCVSLNLAFTLAQKGCRVLIVDADFRHPGIVAHLGMTNQVGLSNTLADARNAESSFRQLDRDRLKNLWVLPSGPHPGDPTELLSSPGMDRLLRTMRQQFDHVVIDSPAVLPVTDATILASMADGVVIVVENEKTGRDALLRACRILTKSRARILGAVLNKADLPREFHCGHYSYEEFGLKYYSLNG